MGGGLRPSTLIIAKEGCMPAKVDEIVKSLKKENPSWSKSKVYAIAWATYNKMEKK